MLRLGLSRGHCPPYFSVEVNSRIYRNSQDRWTFFKLVRVGGLGIPSGDFNRCSVLTALAVAIHLASMTISYLNGENFNIFTTYLTIVKLSILFIN